MKHYLSLICLSLSALFSWCVTFVVAFYPETSVADHHDLPKRAVNGVAVKASNAVNFGKRNPAHVSGASIHSELAGLAFV